MTLRLAFMGTPDFAAPTLMELIGAGHEIAAVYTQPPRPAGRGRALRKSPVHGIAEAHGLPVRTPETFKDPANREAFAVLELDAAVVVAYGLILPEAVLHAPNMGCYNLHASLLPRWRGAAPIQRAIMAGDSETGVTVMKMEAGVDTGPMLLAERVPITPEATAGSLHDTLAQIGASLMVRALAALERGTLTPTPQPEEGVTYAPKIKKEETRIDWSRTAREIDCHIRGLTPLPGAWFEASRGGEGGKRARIKVLRAVPVDLHMQGREGQPASGTVLDESLTIACGEGALRLVELQREGRAPARAKEFLRGFPLPPGALLD